MPLSPHSKPALASPGAHEPGIKPHAWKKAPGSVETRRKKRGGKSPQGLAESAGRESSREHPTLCWVKLCHAVLWDAKPG